MYSSYDGRCRQLAACAPFPNYRDGEVQLVVRVTSRPRRLALHRRPDLSGVSGIGLVAFGTVYPTGRTTLAWCAGDIASVTVYDSVDQVLQIHGHACATDLMWLDIPDPPRRDIRTSGPIVDAADRPLPPRHSTARSLTSGRRPTRMSGS